VKRAVILGARGFVARALTETLRRAGAVVRPVSSDEIDLSDERAPAALSSLLEPDDAVVMPAALTPDKGRDVATLMKNLRMAEHVCQALSAAACSHLLYISSDAVYPTSPVPLSEDTPATPTDLYALMHVAREQMLGHVAKERGIPLCVLRPSAIYGAEDTHNSYGPNRFIRSALSTGTIRLFGDGEEQRDHVYIGDVTAAIGMALQSRLSGVLNVVSGRAVSFREIAECVVRHVGTPVHIECAARTGPVTHRPFDATRLQATLPSLETTSLESGIGQTVRTLKTAAGSSTQAAR
jgi:nucleoside-diphosphate-sugar epimerase